jgi:hypothetical protein
MVTLSEEDGSMNPFSVGAVGKKVQINNLAPKPNLTPKEALVLAAWLVATAAPLIAGSASDVLAQFHKLLGDASEGTDLEDAANHAIAELDGS